MSNANARPSTADRKKSAEFDIVIIGAGFSGLYMLHRLRKLGVKIKLFEAAAGVGGTWYWNRYPGCGSDIESLEYSYGFSEELQQEWKWSKRYPGQAEIERYLNHVADRFDLRKDIQFNTRVISTTYDENGGRWLVTTSTDENLTAQFLVMATGLLSAPKPIEIKGAETFKGRTLHTWDWPKEDVDFTGRRVAVIGTGSSGVQAIPLIAKQAKHLTVFQRTPNFVVPLQNGPLDPEYEKRVKSDYAGWRQRQLNSFGGYVSVNFQPLDANPKAAMEVSEEERRQEFEFRWQSGGLCFYTSFRDLLFDPAANESLAEFAREKIRARIQDPAMAEKLLPTGYPIMTKRLCADTNYFETYNRDNVALVDIKRNPITEITPDGIVCGDETYLVDDIVFATGFDAITGTLIKMDIHGRNGRTIRSEWANGPRTNAGLMTAGFPNMFFANGPGSCTGFFNPVMLIEYQGEWLAKLLTTMKKDGVDVIESDPAADERWVTHMREVAAPTLFWNSNNWYIGANVPGKPRVMLLYLGGFGAYREHTTNIAERHYEGFILSRSPGRTAAKAG